MPVHDQPTGDRFSADQGLVELTDHFLFRPNLWRTVLLCFSDMEACQIDAVYGRTQINWLIRERIMGMPSSDSWIMATGARSLGLLLYLYHYRIPCSNYNDIIQFCVDKNLLELLIFFTCGEYEFYDGSGMPIKSQFCPSLDRAIRRNHINIVRYCVAKFHPKEKFLKKMGVTLNRVMQQNLFEMLQVIVPYITKIINFDGIEIAIKQGYTKIMEYALKHLDHVYLGSSLPKSLSIIAAEHGRLKILSILQHASPEKTIIPKEAYNAAFQNGHVQVCRYIQKRYPKYIPGAVEMNQACAKGHLEIMKTVPPYIHIPDSCFEKAAKSCNPNLILLLQQLRPTYKFSSKLLKLAIESGHSPTCCMVFQVGNYKKIPLNADVELVRKRMRHTLIAWNAFKFHVYTEKAFIEAARICDIGILKDMIENHKFCKTITDQTISEALGFIYVSAEVDAKRGEAYTLIADTYKQWKANNPILQDAPKVIAPQPSTKKRKIVADDSASAIDVISPPPKKARKNAK